MKRRDFLKTSATVAAALAVCPSVLLAKTQIEPTYIRAFTFKVQYRWDEKHGYQFHWIVQDENRKVVHDVVHDVVHYDLGICYPFTSKWSELKTR